VFDTNRAKVVFRLDGLTATTHHGFHAVFARSFPRLKLVKGERHRGRDAAAATARYMEHEIRSGSA
jgi:hypothetical protein